MRVGPAVKEKPPDDVPTVFSAFQELTTVGVYEYSMVTGVPLGTLAPVALRVPESFADA